MFSYKSAAPYIVTHSQSNSWHVQIGMVCYFVKPGTNMIGTRKGAMVSAKSSSCRDGDENYIVLPNNTHPPFTLSASHAVIEYAVTAAAVDGQVSSLSMNDDSGKGDTSEERRKRKERRNGLVLTVASADFNDDQIGMA